jgi:hypothetical protein
MRDYEHQPEPTLLKTPVGSAVTAVFGLVVAAVSLLMFVLDLLVTPEIGINDLIVSFVVCGMGLTTGLILLRRLAPRREPMSLFGGPDAVPVQDAMPAEGSTQTSEWPPDSIKSASRVHNDPEIAPVMRSHGSESIATRKTHDSGGIIAAIATIGMGSLVMGFSWQFLFLALLAGGAVALVLYFVRNRREDPNISARNIPVAGGIIGTAALAGVGLVMVRFHFLRDFLLLAVGAGTVIALVLYWIHRREENSSVSFL